MYLAASPWCWILCRGTRPWTSFLKNNRLGKVLEGNVLRIARVETSDGGAGKSNETSRRAHGCRPAGNGLPAHQLRQGYGHRNLAQNLGGRRRPQPPGHRAGGCPRQYADHFRCAVADAHHREHPDQARQESEASIHRSAGGAGYRRLHSDASIVPARWLYEPFHSDDGYAGCRTTR